ncbi:hypothetical protein [Henriciella sp.]|uniref:hypothetical protein n=1 Tax=Henriciella sp. TaxID=1968823 RepID=UPI00262CCBF2|nr:hypothetical protein [Henriciella sp.]
MTLFLPLLNSAGTQAARTANQHASNLSSSNTEIVSSRAQDAVQSGIFPMEVALVVLGCLMATGFLLMWRESQIERRQHQSNPW